MDFGQVKSIIGEPEVHGSELESRVHFFYDNMAFRLDYYSTDYSLDVNEVPDSSKIMYIMVSQKK